MALGLEPTSVRVKGEPGPGNAPAGAEHLWCLSTRDVVTSTAVSDHLAWLQAMLDGHPLPAEAVAWDVFVYWRTDNGQGGPDLTPEASAFLAVRQLPIASDIYR